MTDEGDDGDLRIATGFLRCGRKALLARHQARPRLTAQLFKTPSSSSLSS